MRGPDALIGEPRDAVGKLKAIDVVGPLQMVGAVFIAMGVARIAAAVVVFAVPAVFCGCGAVI